MSPEQLLQRLADRYAVLTLGGAAGRRRGNRPWAGVAGATCTSNNSWAGSPAGSFELEAEKPYAARRGPEDVDDLLTAMDKSILIREITARPGTSVSWRPCAITAARRSRPPARSRTAPSTPNWYQRLARAADEVFSAQQIDWIKRLDQEMPNLREAVEFSLTNSPEAAARYRQPSLLYS